MPVINPDAVARYLSRPLDNHDWMKEVPRNELLTRAHKIGHRFATDPWENQLVSFLLGTEYPGFCFFSKMGGGKSRINLDLIRYRKRRGQLLRALVLVPERLHVASWEDQILEHAPDLSYRLLMGDHADKAGALDKPSDLCVMTYKGLEAFMTELVQIDSKKPRKQTLIPEKAEEFARRFNFISMDESHRLGNYNSLVYQMCSLLSSYADYRYISTGTPFGRDPIKLWPQLMLVDHGETLGRTLGMFRSAFYTAVEDRWSYSGFSYQYNQKMSTELHRVIKHRSITYSLEELRKDMPQKLSIRLPVYMSSEATGYYRRILRGIADARGDYTSLKSSFTRMRQAASGFVAMRADDESRIEVKFRQNAKLEALREFLMEREDKVLVFHEYILSGRWIEEMLTKAKISYAVLRGGAKDVGAEYQRFLKDPKCRVFVLQNQIGSEAINPQYVCCRAVFYESPVDPIIREQAEGRVYRPGQKYTTFIYDLMVRGTIEEKIRSYVLEGRSLLRAVLDGDAQLDEE